MLRYMKISLLALVLTVSLVGSAGAQNCPVVDSVGDLSGNCKIGWEDLRIFAGQWLNDEDCSGDPNCADLHVDNVVNMLDFTLLAENWLEDYSEITLVINEFMAKNNSDSGIRDEWGDYDDWIEIYNYGDDAINISGMYLTDDPCDELDPYLCQIPTGNPTVTTIPAGGYILIWADEEPGEGPLHVDFKLSGSGEQISLYDASENLIDYKTFGQQEQNKSYGRFPDGNDNWQVFDNPTPGTSNSEDLIEVLISEIMYHPYHRLYAPFYETEDIREEYIELYNRGANSVSLTSWRFTDGVDFAFPNDVMVGAGEYLVVASDVNIFTEKYPIVTNVIGNWVGRLSNSGEDIELVNSEGIRIDRIRYADQGEWAVRELGPVDHEHRGWVWSDEHDGDGKSLELINPAVSNEHGQNWAASTVNGGTPGTVNSVVSNNTAPLILNVNHSPVIPHSTDLVTVSAHIIDELTTGITVTLHYRTDVDYTQPPNAFGSITMFDDGAHDDANAADGIYAAQIPAHPNETIIEYYVQATDAAANTRAYPAPAQPSNQQLTNALYQINDSFDANAYQISGARPFYHIIMTDAERYELLVQIGNGGSDSASDAQMNATFISVDDVAIQTRYNVGVRIRGSGSRLDAPMNFRVNFPHDKSWEDVTAININSRMPHAQLVASALCRGAGLPAAVATLVETRVNAQIPPSPNSPWLGTYVHVEEIDSDFADKHFPDDDKGNAYKCMHFGEYADLRYEGPDPNAYRDTYFKKTNEAEDDWTNLINLTDVLNNSPDINYVEDVQQVVDVNQWMRWFASQSLIGNVERGLANGAGDDYCMYRGMLDTRFQLLPYDLDSLRATGGEGFDWLSPGSTNDSIWKATKVDAIDRFLTHTDLVNLYYAAFHDLIDTTFSPAQLDPLIDELLTGFAPQWLIDDIKQYFVDRNAYVLSVIP